MEKDELQSASCKEKRRWPEENQAQKTREVSRPKINDYLDIYLGEERLHYILSDELLFFILNLAGLCGKNWFILYEPRRKNKK